MQHQWFRDTPKTLIEDRAGRWAVELATWLDVGRWIEEKLVSEERDWEIGCSPWNFTHPTPHNTTLVGVLRKERWAVTQLVIPPSFSLSLSETGRSSGKAAQGVCGWTLDNDLLYRLKVSEMLVEWLKQPGAFGETQEVLWFFGVVLLC